MRESASSIVLRRFLQQAAQGKLSFPEFCSCNQLPRTSRASRSRYNAHVAAYEAWAQATNSAISVEEALQAMQASNEKEEVQHV